jgi:hypothetical protein
MDYKATRNHSPSGHANRPDTSIHQKGMHNKAPSAVEPHPKGPSVNSEATRSQVGVQAPTIGPRAA